MEEEKKETQVTQETQETQVKKKKIDNTWVRQLMVSILGTAIGLGLTLIVNGAVDSHKQKTAQRETAIMAMCDIDEIVYQLKDEKLTEDSLFQVALYVSTHLEDVDRMSDDTLNMVLRYFYDDPLGIKEWTADLKEKAFNSGIDARMNLGNNKFYDNVQMCYYVRRLLMDFMGTAVFRKPLSSVEHENFLEKLPPEGLDYLGNPVREAKAELIKYIYAKQATKLYLKRYFLRNSIYRKVIDNLEILNRENKLLMSITDEDIEEYSKQNEGTEQEATASLVAGTWTCVLNDDERTFVFRDDHTAEMTFRWIFQLQAIMTEEHTEVVIPCPMTCHVKGKWELKSDSLITDFDGNTLELLDFQMDTSKFPQTALERVKDSLEIKKQGMKEGITSMMKQRDYDATYAVSFDKTGNTMLWALQQITPSGKKQTITLQLNRKE